MPRFILFSPTLGVYLGCFWGLGFWSELDPVGQDAASTFETREEAHHHASTWESPVNDLTTLPVEADDRGWATVEACVLAGAKPWLSETTPVMGGMQ